MKNDEICLLGNSIIQHGMKNDRVYLIKLSADDIPDIVRDIDSLADDIPDIVRDIDSLADKSGYSKSFAKVPEYAKDVFITGGYVIEAEIPGFFSGNNYGYFLSKYYIPEREIINNKDRIDQILAGAENIKGTGIINNPGEDLTVRKAEKKDAAALSELYDRVFESYPFPIHESGYIEETMDDNIIYFGIWKDDELLAASSCETDEANLNVEMTDFAVSPEYRGEGYAGILLAAMESEMKKAGYITLYTIARAAFEPVNRLFARFGYEYCGTLKNNTNICGSFESMNVWYKKTD